MPTTRRQSRSSSSEQAREQHTCPMCVGPYPISAVTADPTSTAARDFASRDRDCLGCDGRGLAGCALCRRGCGDFRDPDPDEMSEYCFACVSAPNASPMLRRCLEATRGDGTDECRWDEVDWLDAA